MTVNNFNAFNSISRPYFRKQRFTNTNSFKQPMIARLTNPLSVLLNKKVLVLADVENLMYSSRDLGYKVSFNCLANLLKTNSKSSSLHAFFSRNPNQDERISYFSNLGWIVHTKDIQEVKTYRGTERQANCDNLILFTAGLIVSRSNADVIVIASGDGDLVCSLVDGLKNLPKPRKVATMSLAGSTSWRLDASQNPDIEVNIEIGLDCLK